MLRLTEHERSEPVHLTGAQQHGLKEIFHAVLEPAEGGKVVVRPGYKVGWANISGLQVAVEPKLPIRRILQIMAEAADPYDWLDLEVSTLPTHSIHDSLAVLFARACLHTFGRGLLRAYHREDQNLRFIRGRMNISKYLRSAQPIPIPVTADLFDDDVVENQLLRATMRLLLIGGNLSDLTHRSLIRAFRTVEHVSHVPDPLSAIDSIMWTRQNAHYRSVVELARLILAGGALTPTVGRMSHSGFHIHMPNLIEQWVRTHLRRAWGFTSVQMPDSWKRRLWLDESKKVELIPDLAVRIADDWAFVGDVKYKPLHDGGARQEDIYQLLAYLTATNLAEGVLVYVGIEGPDETIKLSYGGKTIRIVSVRLDVDHPRIELLKKLPGDVLTPVL